MYTIYEYLEHRFGVSSRLFASAVFLLQRASHIAIAIYAVALALQQIVGWHVGVCVALVGGLTTLYTVFGGMKAVLWTDVMQFFVLVGGMVVMAGVVLWSFHGDALRIWQMAADSGHTKMVTLSSNFLRPSFWQEMTIWGLVWGTLVYQVGAYGSDQVIVQRYLAAGSGRKMAQSLIFAGLLQFRCWPSCICWDSDFLRSITCRSMRLCWRPWRTLFNARTIPIWCFRISCGMYCHRLWRAWFLPDSSPPRCRCFPPA